MDPQDHDKQQRLVKELEEFLRPRTATLHHDGMTLAGYSRAVAECGGDWWTARVLKDGRIFVLIADVMGHSVHSAMIMAVGKAVCELACDEPGTLALDDLLTIMNLSIFEAGNRGEVTMTCFAAIFEPATRSLEYAGAAHPQPFLVRRQGSVVTADVLAACGIPLGLERQVSHARHAVTLESNDVLLWYTDGLTESCNRRGKRLSGRRLATILAGGQRAEELRAEIVSALDELHGTGPLDDDVTFVVGHVE